MAASVSITMRIPRELRDLCEGSSTLDLSASSVWDALDELERRHPSVHRSICDETGRLRRHINVFVNSSLVRERQGLEAVLKSGDVITILPAVSGG